jgi:hypothetical protein
VSHRLSECCCKPQSNDDCVKQCDKCRPSLPSTIVATWDDLRVPVPYGPAWECFPVSYCACNGGNEFSNGILNLAPRSLVMNLCCRSDGTPFYSGMSSRLHRSTYSACRGKVDGGCCSFNSNVDHYIVAEYSFQCSDGSRNCLSWWTFRANFFGVVINDRPECEICSPPYYGDDTNIATEFPACTSLSDWENRLFNIAFNPYAYSGRFPIPACGTSCKPPLGRIVYGGAGYIDLA